MDLEQGNSQDVSGGEPMAVTIAAGSYCDEYGNYWWVDEYGNMTPMTAAEAAVLMGEDDVPAETEETEDQTGANEYELGTDGRLRDASVSDPETGEEVPSANDTVEYTEVDVLLQINDNIVGSLAVVSALLMAIMGFLMGKEILKIWLA